MSLSRRIALLLALGTLLGATTLAWLWKSSAEGDRIDRSRAQPERTPAAKEPLAAVRPPTGPDRQVQQPPPIVPSETPARLTPPAADVDPGQSVLIAIHGGTSLQAAQAAMTLSNCRGMEGLGEKLRNLKPTAKLTPDKLTEVAAITDQSARRCQSITEDMQTHLAELAEKGLRAGYYEVSTIYGNAVNYRPPEAMRQPLLDGLRRTFVEGSAHVAGIVAMEGMKLGLTAIEARAFHIVAEDDDGPAFKELRQSALPYLPFGKLSDAEVRQAEALAEQLKRERKKAPQRYDG
ncbi:MAG: hypothetical protein EOP37_10115 [Rubrivivax sp.]|nr:MAG: hypothetical protein EOP37_10115 [Rubrivivax sp.]